MRPPFLLAVAGIELLTQTVAVCRSDFRAFFCIKCQDALRFA